MLNFGASKPRVKGGPPLDPHLSIPFTPEKSRRRISCFMLVLTTVMKKLRFIPVLKPKHYVSLYS